MRYISGQLWQDGRFDRGYIGIEDGKISEIGDGVPPQETVANGWIVPGLVNGHTHCADGGLKVPDGTSLLELVAPPNGLKHRYLRETPADEIARNISSFGLESKNNGISASIDFREGGAEGCMIIRDAYPDAVVLGRPLSAEYDANEMNAILSISDGIGISSITDLGTAYSERIADDVHRLDKMLALHVSERVREDIDAVLSLEPDFVVHMSRSSDHDMRACADAGVPIVVCPRSNRFFDIVPPIARILESGADLAFGTDNAMLCDPDLRKELSAAVDIDGCTRHNGPLLASLIQNGRKLLNRESNITPKIGAEADFVVFPEKTGDPIKDILAEKPWVFRCNTNPRGRR